ncbi:MAG: four-carbon acid sugar kinase family protein [Vulcanimicrobiaceae bacterium]
MARYIVADDLTGACDAALAFAKRGVRARVWLDARDRADDEDARDPGVLAIDLDTRERSPACAAQRMTALLGRLQPRRPSEIVQKIDSMLRGNVASETRAILDARADAIAIVAPSFPAQGRTIRDGYLHERERRVERASLHELFAGVPFVALGLATLRRGGDALAASVATLGTNGVRIALADAETDADLRALVRAAGSRADVVWVGSAGIVEALAGVAADRATPASPASPARNATRTSPEHAPRVLFLIGSRTATTRAQIADFGRYATVVTLDAGTLAAGSLLRNGPDVRAAIARAATALHADGVALVAIGGEMQTDERAVRKAFAIATAPLVRDRTGLTVVLSGGAIARAFCDGVGIVGLDLHHEVAPGTPRSRAIGAPLWIVTKSGGFGPPHAYREVLASIRERRTA